MTQIRTRNAQATTPKAPPRILIENVAPAVDGGRYPVKRVAGAPLEVQATVFRDGHARLHVALKWRALGQEAYSETPMRPVNPGLDLWQAEFPMERNTRYFYTIEAWTDAYGTWLADLKKRVDAGQGVASEALEGAALIDKAAREAKGEDRRLLQEAAEELRAKAGKPQAALATASEPVLLERITRLDSREDTVVHTPELCVVADRTAAAFSAWYEMFPRSQGRVPGKPATFREAERRLKDIAEMGFDVLYLPPIHPIGLAHRKGRNNAIEAASDDPGSPWAIGSPEGGHDAVNPDLGTLADFDHFVRAACDHGLEIALDLAVQCSPDHPWVKEHPDWFYRRPDGTIKYAENPPKKYQDIYPVNFDTEDREALWKEHRRIFEHWIRHGVTIFRVDNPHTKPPSFWEWLIRDIQEQHPEVFFLAEAFTRPPMLMAISKLGFTQSYTYFTWRNTKTELTQYLTELTQNPVREFFHPNFFANTPDILPDVLVNGGRPAFRMRLILAATLSPTYGIYSGFELCENEAMAHHAVTGEYEYANSEKYEIRVRDWDAPGNIKDLVARINRIRREYPALQELANIRFLKTDNDQLLAFLKKPRDYSNPILTVVNLDPHHVHAGTVLVPLEEIGVPPGGTYEVQDLLTDARYSWSETNYVRLDPAVEPAHVLRVERSPG